MRQVFRRLSRRGAALAVIALAALGVGAAVAAIPSGNGTIRACANRATGVLRVIDVEAGQACNRRLEDGLAWNEAGLSGADVRTVTAPPSQINSTPTEMARLDNLSAGAYIIRGDAHVIAINNNADTAQAVVTCDLNLVTGLARAQPAAGFFTDIAGHFRRFESNLQPELVTHITNATDSVRMVCFNGSQAGVEATTSDAVRLTAIPVPTINGSL